MIERVLNERLSLVPVYRFVFSEPGAVTTGQYVRGN